MKSIAKLTQNLFKITFKYLSFITILTALGILGISYLFYPATVTRNNWSRIFISLCARDCKWVCWNEFLEKSKDKKYRRREKWMLKQI